jgi:hypothetical protein
MVSAFAIAKVERNTKYMFTKKKNKERNTKIRTCPTYQIKTFVSTCATKGNDRFLFLFPKKKK